MIKINFSGMPIYKRGHYGCPWWNYMWKQLKRGDKFNDEKIFSFLRLTDTLIRLDLHDESLWRTRRE